jgi:hypothetical protein
MTALVPVTRTVVDTPEVLERLLRTAHANGRLVTPVDQIKASPTARNPEKWWIRADFLEPVPKQTLRQRWATMDKRHPIAGPVFKALTFGLAVVAGLLAIVASLVELVVHTVPKQTLIDMGVALLILAALAVFAVGRGSSGRHSSHDGKGWHYTDCK